MEQAGHTNRVGNLAWTRLAPFGASLSFDLRAPMVAEEEEALRVLLWECQVLIFRNQELTHDRQADLIDLFAPVRRTREGMHFVSNDRDQGTLGKGELPFHSDASFLEHPRTVLSLHAVDVVDGESSTKWASARIGLANMPAAFRDRLRQSRALQVLPDPRFLDRLSEAPIPPWLPHHWYPAIVEHPQTGEELVYLMEMQTVRIAGLAPAESRALIEDALACIYRPDNLLEHVWRNGDFVIWDNLGTQHSRGSLFGKGRRTLQKVQAGGQALEEWPAYHTPELQALLVAQSVTREAAPILTSP